ncbi:MAG TPA: fused MFS/spermidine synthase [Solirubrobacteraceae bacterium]|nr:fused MFS/spermidine synthase [Solirubrobacteraceae bacterium]
MHVVTGARRDRPPLELLVFVVGAASLGAEIAAARLLAPYFGASTIVWANTIATVLVSLAAGYWIGGRIADRAPHRAGLSRLILAAAVLLAAVPFAAGPFLRASVDAFDSVSIGGFFGSLAGVLALVAVPVLLLGAASPYAVRLTLRRVDEAGTIAGRLYAISTAGSLLGTFLSALALIPLIGTRRTFETFALALALVAAPALPRRYLLVPLALAALLALPTGTVKAVAGERVLLERETPYQYVRVVEAADGERRLELNEGLAVHSLYRPGSYLTDDYWDDFLVLPWSVRAAPPRRIAILGNAAGTTARAYGHFFPATAVDGVEIDRELTRLGRRYFDERGPRLRVITADARPFLSSVRTRYDAIVLDAYRQPYIPFYLTTREFFSLARARLARGGVVMINVGHPSGSQRLERVLAATLRAAGFQTVLRDAVESTNTLLLATDARATGLRAATPRLPVALRKLGADVAGRLAPAPRGGEVYTDDRAPVEWLIDSSLVSYAAGRR